MDKVEDKIQVDQPPHQVAEENPPPVVQIQMGMGFNMITDMEIDVETTK